MDFYESRYFNINKNMLRFMGLWPYQSKILKIFIHTLVLAVFCILFVPQIVCFNMYRRDNGDKTIQAAAVMLYLIAILLKYTTIMNADDRLKATYESICKNWKLIKNEDELSTLKTYSEFGRLLTIGYIAYMYSAGIFFVTMPYLVTGANRLFFGINDTRIFILDGEYGIDKYENYGKIYAFESFTCIFTTLIFCPLDTTYSTCVQQCVGLMAVIKMRLKMATSQVKIVDDRRNKDANYYAMIDCIKLHKDALHFVNTLESSYSKSFLVVMTTNALILSVGAIVIIMNLKRPFEFIRFSLIYLGLFIHMFYLSWPGQRLIDISSRLFEDTYNNKWYECSVKTQKLLNFMMLRCKDPCHLTAGGLYVMNMANFGSLAKTSMSYITVFASYR